MKMLKQGRIKIDERYKKCKNCGCEFIYDRYKDKVLGTIDGYELDNCVECPYCGFLLLMGFLDKKVDKNGFRNK